MVNSNADQLRLLGTLGTNPIAGDPARGSRFALRDSKSDEPREQPRNDTRPAPAGRAAAVRNGFSARWALTLTSVVAISGSLIGIGTQVGCARNDSRTAEGERLDSSSVEPGPTSREVTADWNDVEAAAWAGAEDAEATLRTIDRSRVAEGILLFDLRTIRDLSGTLLAVRTADGRGEDHEGARVRLECVVGDGPLRDRATEQRLIDRTARRLDHLLGVEFAPVR